MLEGRPAGSGVKGDLGDMTLGDLPEGMDAGRSRHIRRGAPGLEAGMAW